ncbi:unnamed protein product, partial [Nesidiocoris tenuis]
MALAMAAVSVRHNPHPTLMEAVHQLPSNHLLTQPPLALHRPAHHLTTVPIEPAQSWTTPEQDANDAKPCDWSNSFM